MRSLRNFVTPKSTAGVSAAALCQPCMKHEPASKQLCEVAEIETHLNTMEAADLCIINDCSFVLFSYGELQCGNCEQGKQEVDDQNVTERRLQAMETEEGNFVLTETLSQKSQSQMFSATCVENSTSITWSENLCSI